MEITSLGIEGAWLATSTVHTDYRGNFCEWFRRSEILQKTGIDFEVEQSNISRSSKGVIRGIHYSLAPDGQAKWVTCTNGRIIDVVVDIRPWSPTYKKFVTIDLLGGEGQAVFVGAGLGHGFIAIENESTVSYLLSSTYSPNDEYEINPLDSDLAIDWHLDLVGGAGMILSPKDASAPTLILRLEQGLLPL